MRDVKGLKQAKAIAAKAPTDYASLKAAVEARIVRWEWASFARHSFEPAYFEISKFPRGKLLPGEPNPPAYAFGYGFDSEGRVVIERQQTSFPGMFDEIFYLHEPNGILSIVCGYYPAKKKRMYMQWFAISEGRVVARYSVRQRPATTITFQYNDRGQMVRRDHHGKDGYGKDVLDWYELEYDAKGRIDRIHRCYPDGNRIVHFQRPRRKTSLKALKKDLLDGLTAAIIDAISRTGVNDPVYVLVLRYSAGEPDQTLPPVVALNTVPERERLMQVHGDYGPQAIWNPCEWKWDELDVKLSPELEAMCAAANQDIWQNERDEPAILFLVQLAQALNKAQLPVQRADEFVSVVVAMELGDYGKQVEPQIPTKTRQKLRQAGWLAA